MTKIFDIEQENYRSIWKQKIAPFIVDNREHANEKSEKNNDDEDDNDYSRVNSKSVFSFGLVLDASKVFVGLNVAASIHVVIVVHVTAKMM